MNKGKEGKGTDRSTDRQTYRQTDRPADRQTDIVVYREVTLPKIDCLFPNKSLLRGPSCRNAVHAIYVRSALLQKRQHRHTFFSIVK